MFFKIYFIFKNKMLLIFIFYNIRAFSNISQVLNGKQEGSPSNDTNNRSYTLKAILQTDFSLYIGTYTFKVLILLQQKESILESILK